MIQIRQYCGREALGLAKVWQELYSLGECHSPFLLWPWIEGLLRVQPHFCLVALWRGREVVGLVPLDYSRSALSPLPVGVQEVLPSGLGWPAHLDGLFLPEEAPALAQIFWRWLCRHKGPILALRRVAETSPLVTTLSEMKRDFFLFQESPTYAPYTRLPSSKEDFLQGLTKTFRKKLLYRERRLKREFEVRFEITSRPTETQWRQFLYLHRLRLKQTRGDSDLLHPKVLQCHRRLLRSEGGWAHLSFLYLDGIPRAALYDLCVKQRVFSLSIGLDPAFQRYSLGNLLTWNSLQYYIQQGYREYNLLPDPDVYKFMWADQVRTDQNVLLLRKSVWGRAVTLWARLREALKKKRQSSGSVPKELRAFLRKVPSEVLP